ncbi:MAG: cobalamin biosynthesis protein [Cloacibacillus sp.]
MKLHAAAFSKRGAKLAEKIARALGGAAWASARYAGGAVAPISPALSEWTGARFLDAEAIVFVGSCGIAVRAIAPYIKYKTSDPAVVVVDELGNNAVSLLSGHIGGANDLARLVAETIGARAVITTATDINGITPPDSWAVKNDCRIENLAAAKETAAALLSGERVGVAVTDENQPAPYPVTLWLRPKVLTIGVGCTKNKPAAELAAYFDDFMKESGFSPLSLAAVASIEAKKDEPAIAELAKRCGVPFKSYSADTLMALPGSFTPSPAAMAAVGADNVCERAALAASEGGYMVRLKTKYPGVTFALARMRRNRDGN